MGRGGVRRSSSLVAVLGVLVGVVLVAPGQARADEEAWSGLRAGSSLVADLPHGHLFVSEGAGRSRIAVTDLQGTLLTTITGLAGPGGMALSPDGGYVDVALADGHAIARIDTGTLDLASTFSLPTAAECPSRVAESGGKVWFEFVSCDFGNPDGLAALDPETGQVQVLPGGLWADVQLLTAPSQPNLLVTVTRSSPASVSVYDTSGSAPPVVTSGLRPGGYALSPDGETLYVGTSSGTYSSTLAAPGSQTQLSSTRASSLSVSPDGTRLAAGQLFGTLCVLDAQSGTTIRCRSGLRDSGDAVVSLGGDAVAAATGPDSPQSVDQGPPGAWLEILDDPNRALTRLDLSTPYPDAGSPPDGHSGQVSSGTTVSIQGSLSAPDVSGVQLSVSRRGPQGADLPMMPAVADSNGAFAITDTPLAAGRYRYLVRYAGSPTQAPSTAEYDLDVQPPVTRVLLEKDSNPNALLGDPVHQRVFVAESDADDVRAFDEQGQPVGTASGLPGASALVQSADSQTLYVAVPGADEVVALDPVTLGVINVWPTGPVHGPRRLALVNGRMLVAYRNDSAPYDRGIAAFDPSLPADPVVALSLPGGETWNDPALSADPAVPDGLLVVDDDRRNVLLYSVGPSSLNLVAQSPGACQNATAIRNGQPITRTAQGRIYCGDRELDATTLAWHRAVGLWAVAPSGDLLAGVAPFGASASSPVQLRVQPVGDDDYTLAGSPDVVGFEAIDASAWTSDGTGVFTLGAFYDTSGPSWVPRSALFRLDASPAQGTTITATATPSTTIGASIVLAGTVATADGQPLAGASLRLIARGPAGSVSLPRVVTDAEGMFTAAVTPQAVGGTTYDIEYDGLLHQAPAWTQVATEVAARTGTATLSASTLELAPGQTSTLTLSVGSSHGPSTASLTTSNDGGSSTTPSVAVTEGTATFTVAPSVDSTYSVHWSGDDWDTPAATAPLTIAVRPTTRLLDAPAGLSRSTSATVHFTSSDPRATSTCRVDGTTHACTSPLALSHLAQGAHTLTVTSRSGAGAVGAPATAKWVIDSALPKTSATLSLLGSSSLVARWIASDPAPGTGIARYVASVTNSRGTVVATASSSTTSLTVPAGQGLTYRLSVKAVDRAGNVSPAATAIYTMPVDDRHFAFSSGWTRVSSTSDFAGSTAAARLANKRASYTATGRRYVLWATTCPSCGRATVTVAGVTHSYDLYSPTTHHRVAFLVYASTTSARRTVTIKTSGTRRAASSGTWVKVDALQTAP